MTQDVTLDTILALLTTMHHAFSIPVCCRRSVVLAIQVVDRVELLRRQEFFVSVFVFYLNELRYVCPSLVSNEVDHRV
jgi:hypothetical protein